MTTTTTTTRRPNFADHAALAIRAARLGLVLRAAAAFAAGYGMFAGLAALAQM